MGTMVKMTILAKCFNLLSSFAEIHVLDFYMCYNATKSQTLKF